MANRTERRLEVLGTLARGPLPRPRPWAPLWQLLAWLGAVVVAWGGVFWVMGVWE